MMYLPRFIPCYAIVVESWSIQSSIQDNLQYVKAGFQAYQKFFPLHVVPTLLDPLISGFHVIAEWTLSGLPAILKGQMHHQNDLGSK